MVLCEAPILWRCLNGAGDTMASLGTRREAQMVSGRGVIVLWQWWHLDVGIPISIVFISRLPCRQVTIRLLLRLLSVLRLIIVALVRLGDLKSRRCRLNRLS